MRRFLLEIETLCLWKRRHSTRIENQSDMRKELINNIVEDFERRSE
jgi:hypothetical protein